jgi:Cu2+-exporting ATPase
MNTDAATPAKNIARGKEAAAGVRKVTLPVTDMSCAACAVSVESMLKAQPGVEDAAVNFANQTASVAYHPARITLPQMRQAIQSVGYDLIIDEENAAEKQDEARQEHYRALKTKTTWAGVLSVPLVGIGMFGMDMPTPTTSCWPWRCPCCGWDGIST